MHIYGLLNWPPVSRSRRAGFLPRHAPDRPSDGGRVNETFRAPPLRLHALLRDLPLHEVTVSIWLRAILSVGWSRSAGRLRSRDHLTSRGNGVPVPGGTC